MSRFRCHVETYNLERLQQIIFQIEDKLHTSIKHNKLNIIINSIKY